MTSPLGLKPDLPVVDITSEAIGLLWQKRAQVVRMFLPVLLLLAGIDWFSKYLYPVSEAATGVVFQPNQVVFILASLLISILMATACHRFTLLPKEQWEKNALHSFRREEWRYLLRFILILLMALLITLLTMLAMMVVVGQQGTAIAAVVGVMTFLYVMSRLVITLPALALGQQSSLSDAWQLSRGYGSKLVLIAFIIPILMGSPFMLMAGLDSDVGLLAYLGSFGIYITTLISLVMLSLSYQFICDLNQVDAVASSQGEQPSDSDNHFDA